MRFLKILCTYTEFEWRRNLCQKEEMQAELLLPPFLLTYKLRSQVLSDVEP
jgi:hypothetical protein